MYRLAYDDDLIQNDFVQKIVSRELAAGFRFTFGISEKDYEIDEEQLDIFCSCAGGLSGVAANEELYDKLKQKLETMLKEIEDLNYEYTFDCFGEYLLYSILNQSAGYIADMETDFDFTWKCSVSDKEKSEVYSIFLKHFMITNDDDELTNIEMQQMAKSLTDRITYFPRMVDEPNDKSPQIDILFWDRDFLFYRDFDDVEMVSAFIQKNADALGFIEDEEREPISGSLKNPLQKVVE